MHHKLLSDTVTFEIAKVEQKRQWEHMSGLHRGKNGKGGRKRRDDKMETQCNCIIGNVACALVKK